MSLVNGDEISTDEGLATVCIPQLKNLPANKILFIRQNFSSIPAKNLSYVPKVLSQKKEDKSKSQIKIEKHKISVADPGCLSRIRLFSIPDPGSELSPSRILIKEFKYFLHPKNQTNGF